MAGDDAATRGVASINDVVRGSSYEDGANDTTNGGVTRSSV